MKHIAVHQIDAFTTELFGGNPAGLVSDAHELSDNEMQQIAREMNLSETAFVLPPTNDAADLQLRYFTPSAEVKFCGHATVGALAQLARLSLYGLGEQGTHDLRVETKAGILAMAVLHSDDIEVIFTAPELTMEPYRLQGKRFAEAFGVPVSLLKPGAQILHDATLNYVYIPVNSQAQLDAQQFDFAHITEAFADEGIVVFSLLTPATGAQADIYTRGLAPLVGVNEDPFTGSMQAGLVYTAAKSGFISNQHNVRVEQGHAIGRPGSAIVSHDEQADVYTVRAQAVPVFSTIMELPS